MLLNDMRNKCIQYHTVLRLQHSYENYLMKTTSFVFTVPKLKRFFSLKDKVALPLRSSVVYKFQCEVDPHQCYIGNTYRHLGQRVKEHKSKASAIYDHRLNCSCRCSVDQFSIIDTASDNFSLNIKEAIYIKQIQPSLNRTLKDKGSFHNCVVI